MKVLVTGGGGFLGGAIVARCLARGYDIVSLARADYPALRDLGVHTVRGDLADSEAVSGAAEGCDAVFHVAAKPGIWGSYDSYYRANTLGTENVIAACRAHGVGRLVYTSTPSVIHGGDDVAGVDESAPYPDSFLTHYPATKALAEQAVLAAHSDTLRTVALRPHLIWGPKDNHLVPRMVARAKAGQLRLIGDQPILVDSVYVDNAADAHLNALDALEAGRCGGKAYFITNGEPMDQAALINGILGAAGLPPVTRRISPKVAYAAGWVFEKVYGLFRIEAEPRMTRFLAKQLSTAHWYDISAARRDLGYAPAVSIAEGLERLARSLREEADATPKPAGHDSIS